jgi:hypothetical protein
VRKYSVTFDMDNDALAKFLEGAGPSVVKITAYDNDETPAPKLTDLLNEPSPRTHRAPRAQGGSKVDNTILEALKDGAKTSEELKAALVKHDLSPGSVSKLAVLQKIGKVKRGDRPGSYALAAE